MNPHQLLLDIFDNRHESENNMQLNTETYTRKSFDVEAVQVTDENIEAVAKWCGGDVRSTSTDADEGAVSYIKVRVFRPMSDRQTRAYVGDWVLYAGTGYKVYPPKPFEKCFDPAGVQNEHLMYDEETLVKVHRVLAEALDNEEVATETINALQTEGILFRERA